MQELHRNNLLSLIYFLEVKGNVLMDKMLIILQTTFFYLTRILPWQFALKPLQHLTPISVVYGVLCIAIYTSKAFI